MAMRNSLGLFLVLVAAAAAGRPASAQSPQTKSDLGDQGNIFVAKTFDAYRQLHPDGACRAQGSGKRVLVAGYGLFSGVAYNISGTVVRSMADPTFWPDQIVLGASNLSPLGPPVSGLVQAADDGGVAYNRSLVIDGERYEACFLVLDVIWDLAGAIVIHEESRFKPQLIVMTGRGNSIESFEAGAINRATPYPGYDADGRPLGSINVPQSDWLLPDSPVDSILPMTWNAQELAAAAEPEAELLGYSAVGQKAARPENNYLCNDISYVALHASLNKSTSLAGDRIVLDSPELPVRPVVGFMHFPAADGAHPDLGAYRDGIFAWGKILAKTIELSAPRAKP
jgi:hypothetical protein